MEEALPNTLWTLGNAICSANVHTNEEIWRVVLETAQRQLDSGDAADTTPPAELRSTILRDVEGTIAQLFLVTCYDIFNLAKAYEHAPWDIGPHLVGAQKRAFKRCVALKQLNNSTAAAILKSRGDHGSSTGDDDDDDEADYCDDLPDVLKSMPPPTFRRGPRRSVRSCEPDDSDLTLPVFVKSDDCKKELEHILSTSFVFEGFIEYQALCTQLLDALKPVVLAGESDVFAEGDSGDGMYFISEGTVKLTRGDKELKQLSKGDIIGELAVLHDSKRTYTATVTSSKGYFYYLDRKSYQNLLRKKQVLFQEDEALRVSVKQK